MTSPSFAFRKWYIDCLTADGRLAILYWTSLKLGALHVNWHSVLECAPATDPRSRSSVMSCREPVASNGAVRWASSRLHCEVELKGGAPIAAQELAPGVKWTCVVPGGVASVRLGDTVLRGTGYAEVIDLTVPPWTLRITQLRWGRWISNDAARSLVWIEWLGQRQWAFLDNTEVGVSGMTENSLNTSNATLELGAPVTVLDRGLRGIVGKIAALSAIVPEWLLGGHEHRRTRSGVLRENGREIHGTAVDEIVDFG